MKGISLDKIAQAVDGRVENRELFTGPYIHGVSIDSRQINEGDLYVPIIGERFDGHDFIHQAVQAGAALVFANEDVQVEASVTVIYVKNTKKALGRLAAYYRSLFDIPFIAITGSVGKTSTKEMVASILSKKYKVLKTEGNFNNDIGLPLTLLSLQEDHEIAVIEMGMNHFGEICYLSEITKPTMGIITNIGVSHIEFLGSQLGIYEAKTEMLEHIAPGGDLILFGDDPYLGRIEAPKPFDIHRYGFGDKNDCKVLGHSLTASGGQKMTVSTTRGIYNIEVDYAGRHILVNGLAGLIAGECLGLEQEEILEGIRAYKPAKMRLNLIHLDCGMTIIDDCYNASVDSMKSTVDTLLSLGGGRKTVAILGSMFEMGGYSDDGHYDVGLYVATSGVDQLICIGQATGPMVKGAVDNGMDESQVSFFEDQSLLFAQLDSLIDCKSVIAIKASRGMKLELTRDEIMRKFEV